MIYFLFVLTILIIISFWYFQKNILLSTNVNALIEEIKLEGIPEMMSGKKGFVQNGEVKICYEILGEKTKNKGVVIQLNGHSQTMLGFPPNFYKPLLTAGYQIIRIDNRGTGESDWIKNWTKETAFSLEDMATDVIVVMDKLDIKSAHIAGYSMGGMIGQRLAISYPDRVLSLTSIMTAGFYDDPELTGLPKKFALNIALTFVTYAFNMKTIEDQAKLHLAVNRLLKGRSYEFDNKVVLQKAMYELTRRNGYNMHVEKQHTKAIQLSGSRYDELKKMQTPTLVIHGTGDPLVLFENAKKYAPMIPNVTTLFIENLGHHFPKSHSKEITNAILRHLGKIK